MGTLITTGSQVPEFRLPDLTGRIHSLSDYAGKLVILNFWSAECPWVQRSDELLVDKLAKWHEQVQLICIASNANEGIELLSTTADERRIPLVLVDQGHVLADLYGIEVTPHYFLIDPQGKLQYEGAFDDMTFRKRLPERAYLFDAVDALLDGKLPDTASSPAYGCSLVREAQMPRSEK